MAKGVVFRPRSGAGREMCELPGVGNITSKVASSIESAANGALSPDGYSTPGFETKIMEMNGYVVRTKTDHARRSENKNKTLTKAFHSAR